MPLLRLLRNNAQMFACVYFPFFCEAIAGFQAIWHVHMKTILKRYNLSSTFPRVPHHHSRYVLYLAYQRRDIKRRRSLFNREFRQMTKRTPVKHAPYNLSTYYKPD